MKVGEQYTETRVAPNLTTDERQSIAGWAEERGSFGLVWRPVQRYLLRFVDGTLVAKAGVVEHRLVAAGDEIRIGGVGGVITMPTVRAQGHATALMEYVGEYLCDQLKVQFGMLFCRETLIPFYNRLGWQILDEPVTLRQPAGTISCPVPVMFLSCDKLPWPKGTVHLDSEPW